ncbi:MAG: hypothetical protein JWN79_1479, partial [Gemmatimonadetes bacterium]|nr:hypothetical protein [Gemmatimonadota bacterium]
ALARARDDIEEDARTAERVARLRTMLPLPDGATRGE